MNGLPTGSEAPAICPISATFVARRDCPARAGFVISTRAGSATVRMTLAAGTSGAGVAARPPRIGPAIQMPAQIPVSGSVPQDAAAARLEEPGRDARARAVGDLSRRIGRLLQAMTPLIVPTRFDACPCRRNRRLLCQGRRKGCAVAGCGRFQPGSLLRVPAFGNRPSQELA